LPITDAENVSRMGPTLVGIPKGEGGLSKDSVVLVHQIRVVDESRLAERYGNISPGTMQRVNDALKIILDLK
jgi:mRNA interferase MazF